MPKAFYRHAFQMHFVNHRKRAMIFPGSTSTAFGIKLTGSLHGAEPALRVMFEGSF